MSSTRQAGPGHPASIGSFPSFSTVNFYAGSGLSRISWLRSSSDFLNGVLSQRSTRFVLLNNLNPLVHAGEGEKQGTLATLGWQDVKQTLLDSLDSEARKRVEQGAGADKPALFGAHAHGVQHDAASHKHLDAASFDKVTQGLGPTSLAIVFLGMDESHLEQESMPGQMAQRAPSTATTEDGQEAADAAAGVPYFAVSLSYRPPGTPDDVELPVERLAKMLTTDGKHDFVDTRTLAQAGTWPLHDAAIVAQARSLVDWNERHQYCPSCSRRQYSLWAGWKRACASSLGEDHVRTPFLAPLLQNGKSFADDGRGSCLTTTTLSNFCYPRTDPTVIMAIVSSDGERILLGRQRKWPPGFYSCLAGFLEPGESLEEAVRREVYEESGVQVGRVTYHSSQPWPFPANLMMGAIGQAREGKDSIRLDLDNELEDARFFTRAEVLDVLAASSRFTLSKREVARMDETLKENRIEAEKEKEKARKEGGGGKWDEKDTGSVANVTRRRGSASSTSSDGPLRARPKFRIPGPTAIAHVLISAWARGEAHFPPDPFRTKM